MPELLLTLAGTGENIDIALEYDDRAQVGHLVDAITERYQTPDGDRLTLERTSRSRVSLDRDGRISHQDLRSGDIVRLAPDTGLRTRRSLATAGVFRIVSGSGVGTSIQVGRGESTIGRADKCDITLADTMASRVHAKFIVSDVVEVADLGSTNGVLVNGEQISRPRRLQDGDRVLIGDTELELDQTATPPMEMVDATNSVEFNRPPRVGAPYQGFEIELPQPPDNPPKQRIPMITAIAPLFMGVVLYFISGPAGALFILLSPVIVVGSWWENKRSGRAEYAEKLAEFEADLASTVERLDEERATEVTSRLAASPAVGELAPILQRLSARLWERQPEDEDFLELRVGLAPLPSRTTVKLRQGGARDLQARVATIPPQYAVLPDVPVTVRLPAIGTVGVAGPPDAAEALARALVCQAAVLQSPGELVVGAMLSGDVAPRWDWLKWLPHTRSPLSPLKSAHIATDTDHQLELLAEILSLIEGRRPDTVSSGRQIHEPHILIVVDDAIGLERARLAPMLEGNVDAGISFIWVSSTTRRLPKACGAVIDIAGTGDEASIGWVEDQYTVPTSTCELLPLSDAAGIARALSPVVDVSSRQAGGAEIPRTAPLVELLGGAAIMDDAGLVLDRWNESATGHSLRGPVGAGGSGVFSIDMRHDGPHGLVAGTTGAGKSELLQSMLVGLAATHSPNRITFLLVDYKGGSAFKDCVKLPHTVGLVTDLTPALVKRALTSLRAELHRRERLLNEANAKDLIQMEEEAHPKTPPSLLIVVDEFAALAREVPEFVEGVVDVAQRGRSLGLHLMLATQRPAGVVTDNIRANTNLKIALRVASTDESKDVIGSPAAGNLDRSIPGRALARLGPSELIPFQAGYVGGRTSSKDDTVSLRVSDLGLQGLRPWPAVATGASDSGSDTDLERMVLVVNAAFGASGLQPPRRPWLDPLGEAYDLTRLPRKASDAALTLGVVDDPEHQTQRVTTFDPDREGNILFYGAGGAGKTVALRTLAASAALAGAVTPVQIYGLDFAGRGLDLLEPLPQVGSIVPGDDYERVTRLLAAIRDTIAERSNLFVQFRASTLAEYRSNSGQTTTPRILVLLDGFENFAAVYERVDRGEWHDLVPRLVADGRSVGIHFALTGGRRSAFPMSMTSAVSRRIVLRLANTDEYQSVGADASLVDGNEPPGRGIDGDQIMQMAIVGTDLSTQGQARALQQLGASFVGVPRAPAIQVLSDQIRLDALPASPLGAVTIGMTDRLETFSLPLCDKILIAGPTRAGKTTTVRTIIGALHRSGIRPTVLSGRRPIDGLPSGVTVLVGPQQIAQHLADHPITPESVIVIDGLDELFDTEADFPLQSGLAVDGVSLFAACEAGQARRGYSPLLGMIKRNRRTLILLPDPDLDGDLANTPLPRSARRFPPGRGYFSDAGRLEIVQVAVPS